MKFIIVTVITFFFTDWFINDLLWNDGTSLPLWAMIPIFLFTLLFKENNYKYRCVACDNNKVFDFWEFTRYDVKTKKGKGKYTASEYIDTTKTKSDGTHDRRYKKTGHTTDAYHTRRVQCTNCKHSFNVREIDYSQYGPLEKSIRKITDDTIDQTLAKGNWEGKKFEKLAKKDPKKALNQVLKDMGEDKTDWI